jgi:prepilin-type N-terminal cleavage/methylation domain-containing protein
LAIWNRRQPLPKDQAVRWEIEKRTSTAATPVAPSEIGFTRAGRRAASDAERAAFTLVELLVVITIIVVLLALLTPALDKAMSEAERVRCGANQKGLVNACATYAVNSRRRLPAAQGSRNNNDPHYANVANGRVTWLGVLAGYTIERSHPLLYCPSLLSVFSPQATWPAPNGNYWWGYAYFASYMPDTAQSASWASRLPSPGKLDDRPTTPIVGDVTRGIFLNNARFQATPASWAWISHSNGGGNGADHAGGLSRIAESESYRPLGVNNGHLDGSVVFYRYSPVSGGELEYVIQLGVNPGFVWGKTPGSQLK